MCTSPKQQLYLIYIKTFSAPSNGLLRSEATADGTTMFGLITLLLFCVK